MKLFKLWVHQHNFSEDALIVNPKEFPEGKVGDVLEIYHPEDESSRRLLLQINSIRTDFQQKDTISILQSVANFFQLRTYWDVKVNKVDPKDVSVDLVEVLIKDQYISRNDMWRLSKAVVGSCVYVSKKVSFSGIRSQVHELWTKGEKVSCGVISEDTRVVFRSLTAEVFLFIQMSQEMWDFDLNGDLYFEKTINGFLHELFTKWREQKANHEVTIVLFSRTFYDSKEIDDFPVDKRVSVLQDPYGRFYEDFYQVIVHSEKRDDWLPILVKLKHHFNQYPKYINCSEDETGGSNSSAFEGNFLEAVNLTMNIFEKHYVDRNFERTGQTTLMVTPGPGVFEVDRGLTNITKQRMLDSGVAADLVCMAEQPLHSVPLFKFQNKDLGQGVSLGDDYNIPHWMNHSFYASPKTRNKSYAFVPRIKLPEIVLNNIGCSKKDNPFRKDLHKNFQPKNAKDQRTNQLPDLIDYDEYDAGIFRSGAMARPLTNYTGAHPSSSVPEFSDTASCLDLDKLAKSREETPYLTKMFSPPGISNGAIAIPSSAKSPEKHAHKDPSLRLSSSMDYLSYAQLSRDYRDRRAARIEALEEHLPPSQRFTVGSAGSPRRLPSLLSISTRRPRRTLINPFKPLEIPCSWTCNRHRWAHVFPKDPDGGILRRQFERQPLVVNGDDTPGKSQEVEAAAQAIVNARKRVISEASQGLPGDPDSLDVEEEDSEDAEEQNSNSESCSSADQGSTPLGQTPQTPEQTSTVRRRPLSRPSFFYHTFDKTPVEQDWTAAIKTNVDWKSLIVPACLPFTSEYCPDKETLETDYLEFHYELCIGDDEEYAMNRPRSASNPNKQLDAIEEEGRGRHPSTVEQMLLELVAQRLSKGFQILTHTPKMSPDRPQSFSSIIPKDDEFETQEFFLSLGRNLHRLSAIPNRCQINVTRYRPRHPRGTNPVNYRYRLWADKLEEYQPTEAEFQHDELDKYNWNYLDQHISGDQDFAELLESLKYWKSRLLLLPLPRRKTSVGGVEEKTELDSTKEEAARIEGLLKYLEMLNSIKRTKARRRPLSPKQEKKTECREPRSRSQSLPSINYENKVARASENTTKDGGTVHGSTPLASKTVVSSSLGQEISDARSNPNMETSVDTSISVTDESAVGCESDMLTVRSPLEAIAKAMLDSRNGMTFLPPIKGLGSCSFLGIEGVWWMMHHVDGANTKEEAMTLAQKLMDAKIILHASSSSRQKFVYGFVIFFITPERRWNEVEERPSRSLRHLRALLDEQLREFQGDWFEVAITSCRSATDVPAFLAPDVEVESYPVSSPTLLRMASVRRGRARSASQQPSHADCECGPAYKSVNLNCDPQRKSDRPEWCVIRYHGNYCSAHAFEIEVHWIETTSSVVNELVQSWARKATSCGFLLVPAPVSPFPDPDSNNVDPLRLPDFIPINLSGCLAEGENNIFQGFNPSTHRLRRYLFQEAILEKFGFLKDSPYDSTHNNYSFVAPPVQCRADDYVHQSGMVFVRIHDYDEDAMLELYGPASDASTQRPSFGFFWTSNFMLTKRWRSAATGDVESARKLMRELDDFCSNRFGSLKSFWEACKDLAEDKTTQEVEKYSEGPLKLDQETTKTVNEVHVNTSAEETEK